MYLTAASRAQPLRVLFACTENAARSQFAEASLRHKGGEAFHVFERWFPSGVPEVNPVVADVLRDLGIDWSTRVPKGCDTVADRTWDLIITVCDRAREHCPAFPASPVYAHRG